MKENDSILVNFLCLAFAVNLSLIMKQSHCYINPASEAGMLENEFLKQLGVTVEELEGRANDCKSVREQEERDSVFLF